MKSLRASFIILAATITLPVNFTLADDTELNNPQPDVYGMSLTLPHHLVVNDDDDNNDEIWDKKHCPSEGDDDLREVTVSGTAGQVAGTLKFSIIGGVEKITSECGGVVLWEDAEKITASPEDREWPVPANSTVTKTFWIEGNLNSDTPGDVKMDATFTSEGGTGADGKDYYPALKHACAETTVYQVDLDVDSNNNEGTEFHSGSDEEDKIEASVKPDGVWTKRPGKIIMVNDGFGDDIPDWADGFKSDPSNSSTDTCGAPIKFIPILLERKPPFTQACKVVFSYPASNPGEVNALGYNGFPNYDKMFTKPAGKIRIWKKNNDGTSRKKESVKDGGDYVPVNDAAPIEIDWEALSDTNVAHLFVEAVEASAELADIDVSAEISENGARTVDNIKFTAIKITCEPINSGVIDNQPVNPSGLVARNHAKFQISVEPAEYPDDAIEWESNLPGGTFSPMTSTGSIRNVEYTAGSSASDTYGAIWASIKGNYYDSPGLNIKVFKEWKTVKISTYIAVNADGISAFNPEFVPVLIQEIQDIYSQAGMQFVEHTTELLLNSNYQMYYDVGSKPEAIDLCFHAGGTGGIELYLVHNYGCPGENIVPFIGNTSGIVCRTINTSLGVLANVAAHEIGHSCGLEDIYDAKGEKFLPQQEKAKMTFAEYDWPASAGFNSDPSYYSRLKSGYDNHEPETPTRQWYEEYAMRHEYLVQKLLMYGNQTEPPYDKDARDLPCGRIYGVYNSLVPLQSLGYAEVGLMDMNRNPEH